MLYLMIFAFIFTCTAKTSQSPSLKSFRDDYNKITKTCQAVGFVKEQCKNRMDERASRMVAFDIGVKNHINNAQVGSKIVFDDVKLNIGTGYDASTGIFTAPYSGVYVFEWTLMTQRAREALTIPMVDGKQKSFSHCRSVGTSTYDSCSKVAVVELRAKQQVWIQVLYRPAYVFKMYSSFTGFML